MVGYSLQICQKLHKESTDRCIAFALAESFDMIILVLLGLVVDILLVFAYPFKQQRVVRPLKEQVE